MVKSIIGLTESGCSLTTVQLTFIRRLQLLGFWSWSYCDLDSIWINCVASAFYYVLITVFCSALNNKLFCWPQTMTQRSGIILSYRNILVIWLNSLHFSGHGVIESDCIQGLRSCCYSKVDVVTQNSLSQLLNWDSPSLPLGPPIESGVIVGHEPKCYHTHKGSLSLCFPSLSLVLKSTSTQAHFKHTA